MTDQTLKTLQKIRSHLWDAQSELSLHHDDLKFMDSEDRLNLMTMLLAASRQITERIHTENGWSDVFVGTPDRKAILAALQEDIDHLTIGHRPMKQITITVETTEQVEAILAALQEAEEQGEIDFAFNAQTEEG